MRDGDVRPADTLRPHLAAPAGNDGHDYAARLRRAVPGDGRRVIREGNTRADGLVPPPGGTDATAGSLSRGRQHASGSGHTDGGVVGPASGRECPSGPTFDQPVAPNGYAWWYVDALSDDGAHGLTIIAFVGSVFSPYYAWARRRGATDPARHCAINVVLYGPRKRWAMTERGSEAVQREASMLRIGPSALTWDGNSLSIRLHEVATPIPAPIRGIVRVHPTALTGRRLALHPDHDWSPLAPSARVEVALEAPPLRWSGAGYLDTNTGRAPLERAFMRWDWSRASLAGGDTAILYEAARHDSEPTMLALHIDRNGAVETFDPPPRVSLESTRWRIARTTRADDGVATVARTLTDAPFYARSVLSTRLLGQPATAMHESLDCRRFEQPWVQAMLPFRMPRALRPHRGDGGES
jgi:carotenoid 1,2-hydratase